MKKLDEFITNCLEIERYKSYFIRNIFKTKIINSDESKFLYLIFDTMHNIPEVVKISYNIINNKNANTYCINLFEKELNSFLKLITKKEYRTTAKINDNIQIKIWCNELKILKPYIYKTLENINELKSIGLIES